ncbi:MAG: methyltransferase domain-containing protein [Pseudomonadota bacterium]
MVNIRVRLRHRFPRLISAARAVRHRWRKFVHAGTRYYCPLCESSLRAFEKDPWDSHPMARCPVCGAQRRHRAVWSFLLQSRLLDGNTSLGRFLHFAPEAVLEEKFRNGRALKYLSADIRPGAAMLTLDITAINQPDASFDAIFCSHVLEHVPDDRAAMWELYRILRPGGRAIIQVPLYAQSTFEDPSVVDPRERQRLFGQHDHVRKYGPDLLQRLLATGFEARAVRATDFLADRDIERLGITADETIFDCRKSG